MAHILAHELGYLMVADCPNGARTCLDPSQITRA